MITPNDLAGYQTLCSEFTQPDDLVIPSWSIDSKDWRFAKDAYMVGFQTDKSGYINVYTSTSHKDGPGISSGSQLWRVYRKMPCPTHLDDKKVTGGTDARSIPNLCDQGTTPINTEFKVRFSDFPSKPKAKTDDDGKPPLAYIPWKALDEIAQVQAYGHRKYHDYNNYRKGMEIGRNLSCAMRHIGKYMEGQDLDEESKRNHLAHAACRIMFVLQNLADGVAIDDRFKPTQP